jgi:hypothetical protein
MYACVVRHTKTWEENEMKTAKKGKLTSKKLEKKAPLTQPFKGR